MSKGVHRLGKKPIVKSLYNKPKDMYVPGWDTDPGMAQHDYQYEKLAKEGQVRVPKGAKGIGSV